MKIGLLPATLALYYLASSTEARIGTSRNLIERNYDEGAFIDSAETGVMRGRDSTLIQGISTSTKKEDLEEEQDDPTEEAYPEQRKPLPSLDEVMEDAPKHGMYVEGGADRVKSFCARHNHFGPNSGCEQHASLRGGRVPRENINTNTVAEGGSTSYLQQHAQAAKLRQRSRHEQRQREPESDRI